MEMGLFLKAAAALLALYATISYVVVGGFIIWTFVESVVQWWKELRPYGIRYDEADPLVLAAVFILWLASPVLILPRLSDCIKEKWVGIKPKVLAAL